MDDLIVTGGENVAAAEVEAALLEHPGVTEAAVIGVEDGNGAGGHGVRRRDAPEDDIAAHARARLPGFKAPKRIHVLDELPRTASGKVQRAQLSLAPTTTTTTLTSRSSTARPSRSSATAPRATPTP